MLDRCNGIPCGSSTHGLYDTLVSRNQFKGDDHVGLGGGAMKASGSGGSLAELA